MSDTTTKRHVRTGLFIGGEERFLDDVLHVRDPAQPDVVVGEAAAAGETDVDDAIASAAAAYPAWSALSAIERAEVMADAISGIAEERDEIATTLSREVGKLLSKAAGETVMFERRWHLALDLAQEVDRAITLEPASDIPVRTEVSYQSLGVATMIVPFNAPLAILAAALPHALLAGNTVIVKPPPSAPLATSRLVQGIGRRLPAGVLNLVTGRDESMAALIQSPDVAKVCFTGSVNGGRRMMEMAAGTLTRLTLELGGNDAAVFAEDALLDETHLDRIFAAVYDNSGQICMHAKRIYVHRSRMDELVAGLVARLTNVRLGHGLDSATTMGPLHQEAQRDFVAELIQEAKDAGADVREFGELPGGELAAGTFLRPAIVIDPDPSLRVVTLEQFGPVIPVIPFDTEEDAVAAANDTWGGLGGSVWTADLETAKRIASQLVCGYVWINDHGAPRLDLRAPFGGMKLSGIGREQGIEGVRAFQDTRSIAVIDPVALAAMTH